jgi:hypothetical protein
MLLLLTLACDTTDPHPVGEGLFEQGCPIPGQATARALVSETERPAGSDAISMPGDVVLLNERAAWVIQDPSNIRTYFEAGGGPIDGVAVRDCAQTRDEHFGEVAFLVGELFLTDFNASTIRMFTGQTLEIVNDGRDGEAAVVEVHGVDERFWLVELTMIRSAFNAGETKEASSSYGMDITLRYTLEPDSPVLKTEMVLEGGPEARPGSYMTGMVMLPSDHTPSVAFAESGLSVAGLNMDVNVPWFASSDGRSAYAVGLPESVMAEVGISGVTALVDADLALDPVWIEAGSSHTSEIAFSLGEGGTSAASCELVEEPVQVSGTVSGQLEGAHLEVWTTDTAGEPGRLDTISIEDDGSFTAWLPPREQLWLRAVAEGRLDGELIEVEAGQDVTLALPEVAWLTVDASLDGEPATVRVELTGQDGTRVLYPSPQDPTWPVPPGDYEVVVTRGFEASRWVGELSITDSGTLPVELETVLDTSGWTSIDSHIHSEPSADSSVLPQDRARTVAAAGLDAIITTDHEAIVDLSWALEAAGVQDETQFVLGSEVTATFPEHVNAWPFPPSEHARGEPVDWWGLGFPSIYENIGARGAAVIQLNHARVNGECGILCVLDWDRRSEPGMDASMFLVEEDVWSWDFDAFEVMNSNRSPFLDVDNPRTTGAFQDWLAFHNLGHAVTGMAVTDAHGLDLPGSPRTWLRGSGSEADITDSSKNGHAVMSAGAFARVSLGEAGPGDLGTETVLDVHVQALPEIDVTEVLVLANCELIATLDTDDPDGVIKLDAALELGLTEDSHVVVLGFGEQPMPTGFDSSYSAASVPRFITNPVFLDADGDGGFTPAGPRDCWTR